MPEWTLPTLRVLSRGGLAALLPTGLSLTTLAWQAGRVGPPFVVALGAVTKRNAPRGACAHHHWFLAGSLASEACSGQAETCHA